MVRANARVVLASVAVDRALEVFWTHWRTSAILEHIAAVQPEVVTAPNFSFFLDAPRLHAIYNRRRMLRVAEELSSRGVPVAPHLNTLSRADWEYWTRWLAEHPDHRYVCKEFSTGAGAGDIRELADIQQALGRPLHPLIVSGARHAEILAKHFGTFSIIDSSPFMSAMARKRLVIRGGGMHEVHSPTLPGAPLDDLISDNVVAYTAQLECRVAAARNGLTFNWYALGGPAGSAADSNAGEPSSFPTQLELFPAGPTVPRRPQHVGQAEQNARLKEYGQSPRLMAG